MAQDSCCPITWRNSTHLLWRTCFSMSDAFAQSQQIRDESRSEQDRTKPGRQTAGSRDLAGRRQVHRSPEYMQYEWNMIIWNESSLFPRVSDKQLAFSLQRWNRSYLFEYGREHHYWPARADYIPRDWCNWFSCWLTHSDTLVAARNNITHPEHEMSRCFIHAHTHTHTP